MTNWLMWKIRALALIQIDRIPTEKRRAERNEKPKKKNASEWVREKCSVRTCVCAFEWKRDRSCEMQERTKNHRQRDSMWWYNDLHGPCLIIWTVIHYVDVFKFCCCYFFLIFSFSMHKSFSILFCLLYFFVCFFVVCLLLQFCFFRFKLQSDFRAFDLS